MPTITTGTGLISGLNISDIVSKLMAIEAKPVTQLQERVKSTTAARTAFMELAARLLALKTASTRFDEKSYFGSAKATSSNENVLTASAKEGAATGTYTFRVSSLATNHQLISRGMADKDQTSVGAGTLTIELGKGALNPTTSLDMLNGGAGVRRGVIRITDRSGRSTDVDLSAAFTVDDVLKAINSQMDVAVQAAVRGDHLVVTDISGGTGRLVVADVGGGKTAADLGIAGSIEEEQIVGAAVLRLGMGTALNVLNDGNGIRREGGADDFSVTLRDGRSIQVNLSGRLQFQTRLEELNNGNGVRLGTIRITNRAGLSATVDLSGATNIEQVVNAINTAKDDTTGASLSLTASAVNSALRITDASLPENAKAASNLIIEDITGFAARDLGIAADKDAARIDGASIYRVRTVGDVVRAINYAAGNDGSLRASIGDDGFRLLLSDSSAGSGATTVQALNGSQAAYDLGLVDPETGATASRRILAGLDTVLLKSLNGGKGVGSGTIQLRAADGTTTALDLSGAETVQDVLDAINATTGVSKVRAELSGSSLGIVVRDMSGSVGSLTVADIGGTLATDLRIAGSGVGKVSSGNLQLQYISEATELSRLNAGKGVANGKFRITNSKGVFQTFDIATDRERTLNDVIKKINAVPGFGVVARINDKGDGILLEDTAGGTSRLTVEESGSTTAADLNILGQADAGKKTIDGSFEIQIAISASDTLQDVAAKINTATKRVGATVINDGSGLDPYRLSVASTASGTAGRVLLDGGDTDLAFSTLVEAQDAVVFFGASRSGAVPIVTSSNTVTSAVDGVTLSLVEVSSSPVTVTVARDTEQMISDLKVFVQTFNDVIGNIAKATEFNATTLARGVLFGDNTVRIVQSRLYSMLTSSVAGADAGYSRLSSVGLTVGSGAKLQFDENKFRSAMEANPEAVSKLFTFEKTTDGKTQKLGIGHVIQKVIDDLTATNTGLLSRQEDNLKSREEMFNERITYMQEMLTRKQAQLERQFQAMETALAAMQEQQSALSGLASMAASMSSSAK